MDTIIMNLLIGIIGGIYSGVLVSRVYSIKEYLDHEISILNRFLYYLGYVAAFFFSIETVLKQISDSSKEIEKNISKDSEYLKTHKIIDADKLMNELKINILDKVVDKIAGDMDEMRLSHKDFYTIEVELKDTLKKYKGIKQFKFQNVDECKKDLSKLRKKIEKCVASKRKIFIKLMVKDRILVFMLITLIAIIALAIVSNYYF